MSINHTLHEKKNLLIYDVDGILSNHTYYLFQNTAQVFADAIADRAAGIIIAHNHPSGTLEASHADLQITRRLSEVAKLIGIDLLDHVILSKEGYYSLSDAGLM